MKRGGSDDACREKLRERLWRGAVTARTGSLGYTALKAALRSLSANAERHRRATVMHDLDLLAAAWQWPLAVVERVAACSAPELREMRYQRLSIPAELTETVRQLKSLHWWLYLADLGQDYAAWWRRPIIFPEPFGPRTPLDLVSGVGKDAILPITNFLKGWVQA
jgi:hypothetical protein